MKGFGKYNKIKVTYFSPKQKTPQFHIILYLYKNNVLVFWCPFRLLRFLYSRIKAEYNSGDQVKNPPWINFCQLWLKCGRLEVSGAIVSCFIFLLACLAPATINPTAVVQGLQVSVATVTVVQPDRHHHSSGELPW